MTKNGDKVDYIEKCIDKESKFNYDNISSRRKLLFGALSTALFYITSTESTNAQSLGGLLGDFVGSAIREAQRRPRQIERGEDRRRGSGGGGGRRRTRKSKPKARRPSGSGGGGKGGGPAGPQAPE